MSERTDIDDPENIRSWAQETDSNKTSDSSSDSFRAYTYKARLHTPLFYGSKEGSVIETDPIISATALMHALGYTHYDLEKRYALVGDDATSPAYNRLRSLPMFTSELVPVDDIQADERTFRTVSYATERTVVSQDSAVGQFIRGSKKPVPRRIEGSNAGWHKMREFVGLSPGTDFVFTIWAPPDAAPPEQLGFRAGIKRTGEFRAHRCDKPAESVTLNQFLLQEVYDIDEEQIIDLMRHAEDYRRGNDVRTNRFIGVDRDWAENNVIISTIN